jgi:hypothetical protein
VFFVHGWPLSKFQFPLSKPYDVDAKTSRAAQQFGTDRASKQSRERSGAAPGNKNSANVRLPRELQQLADYIGRFEPGDFCAQVAGQDGVVDQHANSAFPESGAGRIRKDCVELAVILARGARGLAQKFAVGGTASGQAHHHGSLCAMTLVSRNQPEIRLSNRIGPGMRSGLDGSGHALLASIKCAACDHHGAQQVFQLTGRWHFKIDASKHFNLKCGRVLPRKSSVLFRVSDRHD